MDTDSVLHTRPPRRTQARSTVRRCDHLRAAIARRGGYCDWSVDHTGWVVTLYLPQERTFAGGTLEAALAACLEWLDPHMAGESGPDQMA
ncbi:MAG: hypothetical protein ACRDJC_12000 [Thermomicrobiales bacterium]